VSDEATNGAETPVESRLAEAGFTNELGFWRTPSGDRVMNAADAIAALDRGEIEPYRIPWPGVTPDAAHNFRATAQEMDRILDQLQSPPEPPPLPSWVEPWAELVADLLLEKVKPVIRAEVRSALRAEARKQAREPTE
jgi:hypothetical protein